MASGISSLDIIYDGYVGSEIRGEIIKDFVKYILYQRSQIPMYYDQIKEILHRQNATTILQLDSRPNQSAPRRATSTDDQLRLVKSVSNLFDIIQNVFASGEIINQVLIVLGASIVSPKDTYLVSFPTEFYEGRALSRQTCVSHLFRTLYTEDFMGASKPMNSCMNLFVLVHAPRKCNHRHLNLTPRLTYKVPVIGAHYTLNVVFRGSAVMQTNSSFNVAADDLDISGIYPLDKSGLDVVPDACTPGKRDTSSTTDEDRDFVWFEVPVAVKGYKDKQT